MGDKRYRVGGTRGGHDQFKWSDVATDEHRENYLGHSLLAPVGRWQKGKDLTWWNKNKNKMDEDRAQAEMEKAQLKQLDEDLLNEALGLAPKVARRQYSELSNADKKQLLERGEGEDGMDTDRISGLGAGPAKHHDHIPQLTLKERELERRKQEQERAKWGLTEASLVEVVDYEKEQEEQEKRKEGKANSGAGEAEGTSQTDRKRVKEERRAKKEAKKEKKRRKKEKKAQKRAEKCMKKVQQIGRPGLGVGSSGVQEMDTPPTESAKRHRTHRVGGDVERGGTAEHMSAGTRDRGYREYGRRHEERDGVYGEIGNGYGRDAPTSGEFRGSRMNHPRDHDHYARHEGGMRKSRSGGQDPGNPWSSNQRRDVRPDKRRRTRSRSASPKRIRDDRESRDTNEDRRWNWDSHTRRRQDSRDRNGGRREERVHAGLGSGRSHLQRDSGGRYPNDERQGQQRPAPSRPRDPSVESSGSSSSGSSSNSDSGSSANSSARSTDSRRRGRGRGSNAGRGTR